MAAMVAVAVEALHRRTAVTAKGNTVEGIMNTL